jgi:uncharacterized short protein YbdD (DUF466 family)
MFEFIASIFGGVLLDRAANAVFGPRPQNQGMTAAEYEEQKREEEYAEGLTAYLSYIESMLPTYVRDNPDLYSKQYERFFNRQQERKSSIKSSRKEKPDARIPKQDSSRVFGFSPDSR